MRATALPLGAPLGATRAVIRRVAAELEMVNLRWGLRPPSADAGRGRRFVRSEGRSFPSHRCLVPASGFQVVRNGRAHAVARADGDWFYLAGVWRPSDGEWPEAFAILTVEANPEVARYQDRQGAFLPRGRHMDWLDHRIEEPAVLRTAPVGTFAVAADDVDAQGALSL